MSWGAIGGAAATGIVGGIMNDSGKEKRVTTQVMPDFQAGPLKRLIGDAERDFYNRPRDFFPGDTVAGENRFETGALDAAEGAAGNIQGQLGGVRDANQFGLNFARDIGSNPVVNRATEAAINPVQQRLERQILPGLDSSAAMAGQVGSSRHGVVQANALNDFSRAALDATANIQNQALGQGLNLFSNTLAQQPAIAGLETAPANVLDAAGQRKRALEQQQINAQIGRHNFEQNEPLDRMQQYRDLIMGNFGGSAVTSQPGISDAQAAIGAGLTGYGLLSGGGGGPTYQPTNAQVNRTAGYSAPNDGLRGGY